MSVTETTTPTNQPSTLEAPATAVTASRSRRLGALITGGAVVLAGGLSALFSHENGQGTNTTVEQVDAVAKAPQDIVDQQLPANPAEMQVSVPAAAPVETAVAPAAAKVATSEKANSQEYDKVMKSIAHHEVGQEVTVLKESSIRIKLQAPVRTAPSANKGSAFEYKEQIPVQHAFVVKSEGKQWIAWNDEEAGEASVRALELTLDNQKFVEAQTDADGDGNHEWTAFQYNDATNIKTKVDSVDMRGCAFNEKIGYLGYSIKFESDVWGKSTTQPTP